MHLLIGAGTPRTLTGSETATVAPRPNSPATGVPAVTGTAQVGETLAADTSGIADADGFGKTLRFTYQWIANDGSSNTDIPDATGYTYNLVADDVGKTVKVRVIVTDDAGTHETTLTSAATDEVDFAVQQQQASNTPATGKPTISGAVQVGEMLTAVHLWHCRR